MMRVLLAEDDKRLGKLIQYMLEQNDIQVEWVTNGSDIYEYAMYTDYDILILDWMMPGETGVEACSRLRKDGYEKAILMLTARDSALPLWRRKTTLPLPTLRRLPTLSV